ncbi:hypothetical protein D3C76_1712440 [compost metagenome]
MSNGAVSQLVLSGNASNLHLVKELLIEKLGKPSRSGANWIRLKSGASYEAESYTWNSQGLAIDFSRDTDNLDRYTITFSNSALDSKASQSDHQENVDSTR